MELIKLENLQIIDIDSSSDCELFKNMILTIGVFDGIHKAHQAIIQKMNEYKKEKNLYSAVMTFDPHPDYVLGKRKDEGYLTPIEKKIEILKDLEVDYLIVIHFTKEVATISYEDFYKQYLSNFAFFVIGYDFRFGAKALGTPEYLQKNKPMTYIMNEIDTNNTKISSTLVRSLLEKGQIREVCELLGHPYKIVGRVVTGSHIGSSLGFPTANIKLNQNYQSIRNGVYFVRVEFENKHYYGIANVGHNPSINYVKDKRLEVHLFDFCFNIYGKDLSVDFLDYLRDEIKFASKEDLMNQIKLDKEKALRFIGELEKKQ